MGINYGVSGQRKCPRLLRGEDSNECGLQGFMNSEAPLPQRRGGGVGPDRTPLGGGSLAGGPEQGFGARHRNFFWEMPSAPFFFFGGPPGVSRRAGLPPPLGVLKRSLTAWPPPEGGSSLEAGNFGFAGKGKDSWLRSNLGSKKSVICIFDLFFREFCSCNFAGAQFELGDRTPTGRGLTSTLFQPAQIF